MIEPQQYNIFVRAFVDVPLLLGDQASGFMQIHFQRSHSDICTMQLLLEA
jgi:hypothetical protein